MDIDALRAQVARRHNILLPNDDPIFVAVSLNELVLAEYLSRMNATADDARAQSIAAASHQVELAKAAAGKLITESAGYIASQATQRIAVAVDAAISRANEAAQSAARASRTARWAAVMTLLVLGLATGLLIADLFRL